MQQHHTTESKTTAARISALHHRIQKILLQKIIIQIQEAMLESGHWLLGTKTWTCRASPPSHKYCTRIVAHELVAAKVLSLLRIKHKGTKTTCPAMDPQFWRQSAAALLRFIIRWGKAPWWVARLLNWGFNRASLVLHLMFLKASTVSSARAVVIAEYSRTQANSQVCLEHRSEQLEPQDSATRALVKPQISRARRPQTVFKG